MSAGSFWTIDSVPESPDTPIIESSGWGPVTGDGGALARRLTQLLGRQVMLTTGVNEDLLGGLVVRVGDTVYDASLAARLKKMEQVTLDHTKQAIRESLDRFAVTT